MKSRFETYLREDLNVSANDVLVVGVSGGLDSMVLVTLLNEVGQAFIIAHCNFGLRGEASDGDELFVQNWATKNGLEFNSKRFDTNTYKEEKGIGTQEAARDLRHEWFAELKEAVKAKYIALAHHSNDRIETTIFNWTRGAGLRGLSSLRPFDGGIIRPLIQFSRVEIENYANLIELEWREDKSNASTDYSRNYLRHEIMPKIEERFSGARNNMSLSIEYLADAWGFVEGELRRWSEDKAVIGPNETTIDTSEFSDRDYFLLKLYLNELGLSREQLQNLIKALNKSGKLFSTRDFNIFCDRQILAIKSIGIQDKLVRESIELPISGVVGFGSKFIELTPVASLDMSDVYGSGGTVCYLDVTKIKSRLIARSWVEGDKVKLLGMQGKTLLSDLFINAKIPQIKKSDVVVIVDGEDVVWVEGFRIAEDYKLSDDCSNALKIVISDDGNTIM